MRFQLKKVISRDRVKLAIIFMALYKGGISRPNSRERIETHYLWLLLDTTFVSPGQTAGSGLKPKPVRSAKRIH